jgi:hypothetical protein
LGRAVGRFVPFDEADCDAGLCIDEDPGEAPELLSADAVGAPHDIAAPTPNAIAKPPT